MGKKKDDDAAKTEGAEAPKKDAEAKKKEGGGEGKKKEGDAKKKEGAPKEGGGKDGKKKEAAPPGPPKKVAPVIPRLYERYRKEVVPALGKKFGRTNALSLPKLEKIVVNMGVGKALQDKNRMEHAVDELAKITGQRPQVTKARVAVSGFRLREGNEIGCRVTLRGRRMYEFLDRLISIALPRIRDFRGVNPKSFDGNGNYSLGLAEQMVFPEIDPDKVTFTQGMDVTFVTSTRSDDEARELLRFFGMPFREEK